jgi:3-hydroxyacyl-[acyl-carrier-protein] dehydratase
MGASTVAEGVRLTPAEVLELMPQQEPFRFIDEILELDDEHIVASYRFREDADFYRGHFPGNPVTPGVILIETMAQASVVALGIYLYAAQFSEEEVRKTVTVFTDAQVEFAGIVKPGDRVITTGRKVFFRRRKLRAEAKMRLEDGSVVCAGQLSGIGVVG